MPATAANACPPETTASAVPRWAGRLAWLTLAWNIAVVLWGAYVRASQSGAGCGANWPLCNGVAVPHGARWHTIVEFSHRVTSAGDVVLIVAMIAVTFWKAPRGHLARWSASFCGVFIFFEALLGAMLVVLHLVEQNRSWGRAVYLCLHSTNTLLLLASVALTAFWLGRSRAEAAWPRYRGSRLWPPVLIGLIGTLWLAATGAIAALGDTLFPATSLHQAMAQDFAANAHYALRLRGLHPLSAIVMFSFILWLVLRRMTSKADKAWRNAVLGLFALQFCLGIADLLALAPIWLQIVHLLGADLFWITLVLASARILPRDRDA